MLIAKKELGPKYRLVAAIAAGCAFLLLPFAINSVLQGRVLLGCLAFFIAVVLIFTSISIIKNDQIYPTILMLVLVPAVTFFCCYAITTIGIIGVLWAFPAIVAYYIMFEEKQAWIANIILLCFVIFLSYQYFEISLFSRILATLILTSAFSALFVNLIAEQQEKLEQMAKTDALTSLLNRTQLDEILEESVQLSVRTNSPMSLLTIDLDHFKKINDDFGHAIGDTVLIEVSNIISQGRRQVDKVFRLGGEEFLVLLYGAGIKNSERVAENLRKSIELSEILPDRTVTVSIGVAEIQKDESWRSWMRRSDAKLYMAKDKGRNQVVA